MVVEEFANVDWPTTFKLLLTETFVAEAFTKVDCPVTPSVPVIVWLPLITELPVMVAFPLTWEFPVTVSNTIVVVAKLEVPATDKFPKII